MPLDVLTLMKSAPTGVRSVLEYIGNHGPSPASVLSASALEWANANNLVTVSGDTARLSANGNLALARLRHP